MATFGNLLARKGGTAQTGKEVTFTLLLPGTDRNGPRVPTEATALLLPVSMARRARAGRAAEAYVSQCELAAAEAKIECEAPTVEEEKALRFVCEMMHDPEDARKYFVAVSELDTFRDSLLVDQILYINRLYNEMILAEYVELRPEDKAKMKAEAKATFTAGQG